MVFEESVILTGPFDQALTHVTEALKAEGFGVLTQIDMQSVFSEKLGKDIGAYVILGVCNPTIADRALDIEPQIGVLLPCNVVVRTTAAGVLVEATDRRCARRRTRIVFPVVFDRVGSQSVQHRCAVAANLTYASHGILVGSDTSTGLTHRSLLSA